jgi:hypothetical protein
MVTRQDTYALNVLNLISNPQQAVPSSATKKQIASISLNFADIGPGGGEAATAQSSSGAAAGSGQRTPSTTTAPSFGPGVTSLRWEAAAGAFFSSLPVRSFAVSPVYTSGVQTDNVVVINKARPTVVPFASANFRLISDLSWTRWRSAIYLTGGVGINPNTTTADFAAGPSISWRGLMVSPLWHYGHSVRLTQGFTVGESLGASFKGSVTTQTYWTSAWAVGISIRVPTITGR